MRQSIQCWHNLTLANFQAIMYETLLFKSNIITEGSKSYKFEDEQENELEQLRGYLAMKDVDGKKTKYFIEEEYYSELPIRVNKEEEMFFKDNSRTKSVILRPIDITPFHIKAEKCWDNNKEFIDCIAPFSHSQPDQWTLNKLVAVVSYIGKTFLGICSLSEFGKSSAYLILDAITKKCPTFQPRSVPGVLAQITSDGNMVFDEVHDAPSDVKSCMENFSLQVAGNSPTYINGAMRSKHTKPRYDVSKQSITYLYNVYSNYSNPDKQFWNNIWSNTKAMESRFLCLKLDGKLLEEFDKNFDISAVAEENKMFYIKIAKHLLYLRELKFSNGYVKRYSNNNLLNLKGRHKILYEEITWIIDVYADSQEEYDKFVGLLNKSINDYKEMLNASPIKITDSPQSQLNEVVSGQHQQKPQADGSGSEQRVLETIDKAVDGKIDVETLLEEAKVEENVVKKMLSEGTIFEVRPSIIARL